jgi:hypothetical protein
MRTWCSLILLLALQINALPAFAQYEDEEGDGIRSQFGYERGMALGFGGVYQTVQDQAISPLIYSGLGYSPLLNFTKNKAGRYAEVRMQASFSKLRNTEYPDLSERVKSIRAVIDYRQMFRFTAIRNERYQTFAGGMLSGQFSYRNAPQLAGSASAYDYATTLGLAGRITKKSAIKDRDGLLAIDIAIPVLAVVARPGYLNRTTALEETKLKFGDYLSTTEAGFFSKFLRLNTRVSYTYPLTNGNALGFGYSWDYHQVNHKTEAKLAEHTLFMFLMFNY